MEVEQVEGRITELADRLTRAGDARGKDQTAPEGNVVAVGTTVSVRFPGGTIETLLISDLVEEDDQAMVATPDSPLGRALLGRRAGDTVTYDAPEGRAVIRVVSVRGRRDPFAGG